MKKTYINEEGKRVITEARKQQMREYNARNMEKILAYQTVYKTNKYQTDPLNKLERNLKAAIRYAFKNNGWKNGSRLHMIVGLPFEDYKIWIESQFEEGMDWNNYGKWTGQWVIDHKIACSTAKTEQEMISLFHWTNTQPLWQIDNVKKRNK